VREQDEVPANKTNYSINDLTKYCAAYLTKISSDEQIEAGIPLFVLFWHKVDNLDLQVLHDWLFYCSENVSGMFFLNILELSRVDTAFALVSKKLVPRLKIHHFKTQLSDKKLFIRMVDKVSWLIFYNSIDQFLTNIRYSYLFNTITR